MTIEFPAGTVLGYPRIGRHRELKKAVESYWAGVRAAAREALVRAGLGADDSSIPEADASYDHVLDTLVTVGAVPARFADLASLDDVDLTFALARGDAEHPALEMTKWFDTNYHYLVPEIGPDTAFAYRSHERAEQVREAKAAGYTTRPTIVGPVTFLALAKPDDAAPEGFAPLDRLDDLVDVYLEVLADLRAAGAQWVQLDESALVSEVLPVAPERLTEAAARAYERIAAATDRPALFVQTSYAALPAAAYRALAGAGVEAIGVDLVRGALPDAVAKFPNVRVVAGVVDGHNIWRGDLAAAFDRLAEIAAQGVAVTASTSTSLIHVPHTLDDEGALDATLRNWLAFADEKAAQIATLAHGLAAGRDAIAEELQAATDALAERADATGVRIPEVRERAATEVRLDRGDWDARVEAQRDALGLPALPTTTIGSFPQTAEIRRARRAFGRGEIDTAAYEEFLRDEIRRVIELQEDLGLDVLVHGEPERNDMVQYFAEHLEGFAVTSNGWVQSYGSRCTRPSILWGDVHRPEAITVRWAEFAQSLTDKHVKGMLTGPVTILAWSFVRDDQPLGDTARQVALALRDEVADLEAAGIGIIQVDEPALRELLPLERARHEEYLRWSVDAFRAATSVAAPATQVHTHLCYSEFGEVIEAIDGLDADVTSIEAARSRMEVVADLQQHGFARGIGPGVWDIHSPRVPAEAEVAELVRLAVAGIPIQNLWINPDCGLKTRGYEETVASLRNLVAAAQEAREAVAAPVA
jgi:5-methyltetrahydropteroyltriglutamate--homocysteine methyltransferase